MQTLIGSATHSHLVRGGSARSWRIAGHELFQQLLERGIEVRTHWVGERFWWKRVLYVHPASAPIGLQVEYRKHTGSSDRHRIALAEITAVRRAAGDVRTIEIVHGGRHQGRTLGVELPTPRTACLFQERLLGLLGGMGLLGHERRRDEVRAAHPDSNAQEAAPERLTRGVAAQGYARCGDD